MQTKRIVCNWLRYADYLAAWMEIPFHERPKYEVVKEGDEWIAKPRAS